MGGRDHSCEVCGQGGFNDPGGECVCPVYTVEEEVVDATRVVEDLLAEVGKTMRSRNRWIILFNRLERHVSRHHDTKLAVGFNDDADDTLHRAWRQVMKEACEPEDDASPAKARPTHQSATAERSGEAEG